MAQRAAAEDLGHPGEVGERQAEAAPLAGELRRPQAARLRLLAAGGEVGLDRRETLMEEARLEGDGALFDQGGEAVEKRLEGIRSADSGLARPRLRRWDRRCSPWRRPLAHQAPPPIVWPPSITKTEPVVKAAASLAR